MGLIVIFLEGYTWHTGGVREIPDPSLWVLPHLLVRSSGARREGRRIKGREPPTTAVTMLPGDAGSRLKGW